MSAVIKPIHPGYTHWGDSSKHLYKDPQRPFRLWDSVEKKNVRWRYYSAAERAHNAALLEVRWMNPGATIEVYDCRTARHLGTYKRHEHTVSFTK